MSETLRIQANVSVPESARAGETAFLLHEQQISHPRRGGRETQVSFTRTGEKAILTSSKQPPAFLIRISPKSFAELPTSPSAIYASVEEWLDGKHAALSGSRSYVQVIAKGTVQKKFDASINLQLQIKYLHNFDHMQKKDKRKKNEPLDLDLEIGKSPPVEEAASRSGICHWLMTLVK